MHTANKKAEHQGSRDASHTSIICSLRSSENQWPRGHGGDTQYASKKMTIQTRQFQMQLFMPVK